MTDQQRQGFTAGEGFPLDTMPFCDQLGAAGTRFAKAYTPMPACVPARTSLLTGRYPSAHRVRQNSVPHAVRRGDDLLDVLSAAGYRTAFVGKPHMYRGPDDVDHWRGPYLHTAAPDATAPQQEFTEWLRSIDHGPSREPTPFEVELQYPHRIVSDACAVIDEHVGDAAHAENPLFAWVSFPEPHNPYQVPEPYWSLFDPEEVPDRAHGPEGAEAKGGDYAWLRDLVEEKRPGYDDLWRRYRASYCAMMRLIDDQVRRLVEHARSRLGDDILVIFVSDHGDYVGEYGLQRKGAGMAEALMRIPFFLSGPGIRSHVDDRSFVSLVDLLPTVTELIGAEIPPGVQGRSLAPLLTGTIEPDDPAVVAAFDSGYAEGGFGGLPYGVNDRPPLHFDYDGTRYDELNTVTQSGTTRMLRWRDWKLLYHVDGRAELYDLLADPTEMDNRWDDPAAAGLRSSLLERLLRWTLVVADDLPIGVYVPRRPAHNWYPVQGQVEESS